MAKWNNEIPALTEAYISKKGLMDLGSPLKDFCKYLGIADDTYYRWIDENGKEYKREFCEAIKRGKEAYRAALIAKAEKSLLELVEGAKSEDTKKEYLKTENGDMVMVKKTVTTKRSEPNVAATIFALTNLKGEVWKNKQNTDITTNGKDINQQISPAEAAALLKKLEEEV
jgi:hypothetical protein